MDPFYQIMRISAAGLEAQAARIRVVTENIANANSTADAAGGDPYRRKTITFQSEIDRRLGVELVRVRSLGVDNTAFRSEYRPGHVAADEKGYVKVPNVNVFLEAADLKEANRTYQANLQTFRQAKEIHAQTIDLLKG